MSNPVPAQLRAPPGKFKAAILDWLGVTVAVSGTSLRGNEVIATTSDSGQSVNESTILSLSAAWACSRLIAETIATLPLFVYERTPNGRRVATSHPLHMAIHSSPNADTTAAVHWESTVVAMLIRGNARAEKLLAADGRVVGLYFLQPARLSISVDTEGRTRYVYTESNGSQREIPASRIFNIPGFSLDGRKGVSVIQYGAQVFGSAMSAEAAANGTFKNGLHPSVAFTYPNTLRADQRAEARTAIKAISGAVNAGNPVILEAGMTAQEIGINPNDAQLLESRAFSVEEICRWFRVPPFMVGHSEKSTSWGTGIEQQMIGFLTFTLRPWLTRIEQAINKDLLTPGEQPRYYAQFSVEGLLRGDSTARRELYASALQNGWMSPNEIRELENRSAIPGGDVFTVQTNMIPRDQLGKVKQ